MGCQHTKHGKLSIRRQKTNVAFDISLLPDLVAELALHPKDQLTFLFTNFGKPFTTKGFGNWMADRIKLAGLPDRCVTHGLRKAAARRLADCGCSPHQIMAVTGHRSLKEVQRYTVAAEQRRLATDAMARLQGQAPNKNSQP